MEIGRLPLAYKILHSLHELPHHMLFVKASDGDWTSPILHSRNKILLNPTTVSVSKVTLYCTQRSRIRRQLKIQTWPNADSHKNLPIYQQNQPNSTEISRTSKFCSTRIHRISLKFGEFVNPDCTLANQTHIQM
jgi:hypothetical protein